MAYDIDKLLDAVSEDAPCGEDLSFSAEFDLIQDARREDDPTMDYGEWQTPLKQADWGTVISTCTELLQKRSKDLRIASWLTEAWVKTDGLEGLVAGLEMLTALIERFDSDIHPQAGPGDQEQRIGALEWFINRSAQLVRQVPLTRAKEGMFSLNNFESARHLHTHLQRDPDSISDIENKITLEKFSAAVAKTDKSQYRKWIGDIEKCQFAQEKLAHAANRLLDEDSPSMLPLTDSFAAVQQRLKTICNDLGIGTSSRQYSVANDSNEVVEQPVPVQQFFADSATLKTREQALEALRQVAVFFRNTEPHSPVAYLADKAVHWGKMPLHTWLRSVVKDHGTLGHLEEMLGLNFDAETGNNDHY